MAKSAKKTSMRIRIPISAGTLAKLTELATMSNRSMSAILDEAIDTHYRRFHLEVVDREYARVRRNPKVWSQFLTERACWDQANLDGIEVDDA